MKMTLLQIVQSILNDMDSEDVNSINDSMEATQVASIVRDTFYNITSTRNVPEHQELIKLTALSDTNFPTHFEYPTNTKQIFKVWYKNSDGNYREIYHVNPLDFLSKTDGIQTDYVSVNDKVAGTQLRIANDRDPSYYTSFDDKHLVFNSYNADTESTLQESKVRAYGSKVPVFTLSDGFTPDLDIDMFPYLLAESKSVAMSLMKGQPDPKIEQHARRQKSYIQSRRYNTKQNPNWKAYGR